MIITRFYCSTNEKKIQSFSDIRVYVADITVYVADICVYVADICVYVADIFVYVAVNAIF